MNEIDTHIHECPLRARKLTPEDLPALDRFCAEQPDRMLSTRLNLEKAGIPSAEFPSWGLFDSDGRIAGVMLRYGNTCIVVDVEGEGALEFARLIDLEKGVVGIRGTLETTREIPKFLQRYQLRDQERSVFLRLTHLPGCSEETMAMARRATLQDLNLLAAIYAGAESMYRSRANVESKLRESRIYVVEEPAIGNRSRRIASTALLLAEGDSAALVGGVYTLPDARGKGYCTACVGALSREVIQEGKEVSLFYENPLAGSIYRRLGYADAGEWAVLYLSPRRTPIRNK